MNELLKDYFCAPSPPSLDPRIQTAVPAAEVTLEFDSTKGPQDLLGPLGCQVKMKFNSLFYLIAGHKLQAILRNIRQWSKHQYLGADSETSFSIISEETAAFSYSPRYFPLKTSLLLKFSFHKFILK